MPPRIAAHDISLVKPAAGMIGIILAGGRASRLGGGDKSTRTIGGVPILKRVVAALRVQCDALVISANGDPARFAGLGAAVVADAVPDQPGPLAGVLAGLDHVAANHPRASFALLVPADAPFLPHDLVARLEDARLADRATIVCAASSGHTHYVTALWSVALRHDLRAAIEREGLHKVSAFAARHPFTHVTWAAIPHDPFFNVNTPEDVEDAERIASQIV